MRILLLALVLFGLTGATNVAVNATNGNVVEINKGSSPLSRSGPNIKKARGLKGVPLGELRHLKWSDKNADGRIQAGEIVEKNAVEKASADTKHNNEVFDGKKIRVSDLLKFMNVVNERLSTNKITKQELINALKN